MGGGELHIRPYRTIIQDERRTEIPRDETLARAERNWGANYATGSGRNLKSSGARCLVAIQGNLSDIHPVPKMERTGNGEGKEKGVQFFRA